MKPLGHKILFNSRRKFEVAATNLRTLIPLGIDTRLSGIQTRTLRCFKQRLRFRPLGRSIRNKNLPPFVISRLRVRGLTEAILYDCPHLASRKSVFLQTIIRERAVVWGLLHALYADENERAEKRYGRFVQNQGYFWPFWLTL